MSAAADLPAELAAEITATQAITGCPATIEPVEPGRWRVTYADTPRVRCTVDAAATADDPDTCRWLGSELWVDGTRRYLVPGPEDLAALIEDPDGCDLPPAEVYSAAEEDIPIPATVPAIVRHHIRLLARRVGADAVFAVHDRPAEWRIYITVEGVFVFLVYRSGSGALRRGARATDWRFADRKGLVAFYDGAASALSGGVGQLLALLAGRQAVPAGAPRIAGPAPAARQGSVETRRASVFRV